MNMNMNMNSKLIHNMAQSYWHYYCGCADITLVNK